MISCHVDSDQKAQQLSLAYAQKLWNEKGLQCMVLVSFALQVNILLYGVIRKRRFGFQSLLWFAYQMTDFVAVFVLAHLSLQTNDPHHQLVLLWAPVLLLHLGGQDNATAFSMKDNELWKRHLLGLITQVVLAVYVVAKSWHDKQLVAPVVLLFLSGTVKYAERTWALKTATPQAIKDKHMGDVYEALKKFKDPKGNLVPSEIFKYSQEIVGQNKWWLQEDYADLVKAAFDSLPSCMGVLYEIPVAPWMLPSVRKLSREISQHHRRGGSGQAGSKKKDWSLSSRANKMVEIQLVLISDLLYTKFGIRYNQPMILRIGLRLLTLGTTLTALLLFVMARKDSIYSRVDILVTYILLAGAVTLEVCSMLMVTVSSYCFLREKFGVNMFTRAIFCLLTIKRSFPYWSNRVRIYNLVGGCIMEKQASSLTSVVRPHSMWISEKTKELICNELDDEDRCQQFSHVRGQGILLALRGHGESRFKELYDSIDKVDFPRSVLTWHLVTDICFFLTGGVASQHDQPRMRLSQEVSNYLMYLLMKRRVMDSSEGYVAHLRAQEEVEFMLARHGEKVRKMDDIEAIKKMMLEADLLSCHVVNTTMPSNSDEVEGHVVDITDAMRPVLPQAWSLAKILLGNDPPADGSSEQGGGAPWKLIASVWMEMLFYLAPRCRAGFHAENLNASGEFITHVRFLLHNRGLGWNCVPLRALDMPASTGATPGSII